MDPHTKPTLTITEPPYGYDGGIGEWMKWCAGHVESELKAVGMIHIKQPTRIVAHFHLKKSSRRPDLDNMVKVLIESLGAAGLFEPSLGGGKHTDFNTEDHWVHELEAKKIPDSDAPRVEVWIQLLGPPPVTELGET
jgi:hypothetical protein